ncbi:hypothetical protein ACWKW6_08830 [Dyadobacter jiangsuensis]
MPDSAGRRLERQHQHGSGANGAGRVIDVQTAWRIFALCLSAGRGSVKRWIFHAVHLVLLNRLDRYSLLTKLISIFAKYQPYAQMSLKGPIVVIEDDEDDRHLIGEMLSELNLTNQIPYLEDGRAALEYLCRLRKAR